MTSLSGTKERSVSSRSRKYGMPDTSPTKSASFFPETWYRKAYEDTTRSTTRPAPEGAGSMPSSTGTPSPGSGISSPGSFSGSPGTISPGIGTGSPGSLGGSPGFGTGSPASGSGSSPGSERGIWCENCNARLTELKRQALKLLIPGPYSTKDPSFSLLLHDKLQVPNSSRRAWNERDSRCDVCTTHLTQLKQEAVRMVLTLDQWDLSPTSSLPTLGGRYVSQGTRGLMGASAAQGAPGSQDWPPPFPPSSSSLAAAAVSHPPHPSSHSLSSSPSQTPTSSPSHGPSNPSHGSPTIMQISSSVATNLQTPGLGHRLGSKPSSLGLGAGVDRRNGSPCGGKSATASQQPAGTGVNSPGINSANSSNNGNTAALQAHQHVNRNTGGVALYPYQISQMVSEVSRDVLSEVALNCYNSNSPSHTNVPSHTPAGTTAALTTTSAAASFFARAAQKLNLASKKKKKTSAVTPPVTSSQSCDPPLFPTNFSSALLMAPPPAPPCLLRAANKIKDTPGLGKVKVMMRVCPVSQSDAAESSSFLKVDPRKKQITIMDPLANQAPSTTSQKRAGANQVPPKMFTFDAAFPPDASQAEVCAGTVAEVIQSVVNGADGCVFCFGHSKLGKSYTMIGRDDSLQTLGIIPCAISWLFKLINERKEKTGARFSVRVSAVEVWGKEENLKDLLSEVATGSLQDGQSPGVYLCEDPICGMQLQNQSELRAPTAEKAAWFLDAAIAARHSSQRANTTEEEHRNSHMLFTLHIYQYRMEKTNKGGISGGRSRLHLLDLGSCDVKVLGGGGGKSRDNPSPNSTPLCLSLSALGNVILALVNGSKHIPYKDSKLTMLLRESLGNMNCRTTMIAHISASPRDFSETLSTIQIASRVLRMKKKKTKVNVQYTSSSSGGESSCEEGRMRRPTHLRPFHHRSDTDSELPLLRLSTDPDEYSSSEQSCDTVIYVGPNGAAVSDRELTDNEGPPEFVPIIPALLGGKLSETQNQSHTMGAQNKMQPESQEQPGVPTQSLIGQPLAPVPEEGAECLKCNTFAELQERLDCIDGSEEVAKFPFEEVPVSKQGSKQDSASTPPAVLPSAPSAPSLDRDTKPDSACDGDSGVQFSSAVASRRRTNDQQLQEIKEVVEEAELAQTMIHSLARSSVSSIVNGTRCVPGSTSTTNLLHRANSTHIHSSQESVNFNCNMEGKSRPIGSPRLGIASLTKTSEYRPPSSPSQRCKVYTQKGVMPATPSLSSHTLAQDIQMSDALTSDNSLAADSLAADSGRSSTESLLSRTPPVGMSPQVREPTPSLSASHGSAETLCDDDVPPIPLDTHREVRPLSLANNDPVCMVTSAQKEDFDVGALVEAQSPNCRPMSIISFNSDCCAVGVLTSSCHPTGSTAEIRAVEDYHTSAGAASGVTEVVAMAEVAMAKLRLEGEALSSAVSNCGSPVSSWLSDLSVSSEADQSLHSFSQSQSQQGEAMAEPDFNHSLSFGPDELSCYKTCDIQRKESLDREMVLSENGSEKEIPIKEKLNKLPPSMDKTGIQSFGGPCNLSLFKTAISVHPWGVDKPMIIQDHTVLASPSEANLVRDPVKFSSPQLASTDLSFDDPWLKRDVEEGIKEPMSDVKTDRSHQVGQIHMAGETRAGIGDHQSFCNDGGDCIISSSGGEVVFSPDSSKRVVDGCEMVVVVAQGECVTNNYSSDHRTSSLPRGWDHVNRHDGLDNGVEYRNLGVTTSTPCSPRATLDRQGSNGKQGFFSHKRGGIPPLPPIRKSSLDQRNRASGALDSLLHQPIQGLSSVGSSVDDAEVSGSSCGSVARQRGSSIDSSKLFSAKLEQLANRTNSLGRAHSSHSGSSHYDCFSLERGESLRGGGGGGKGDGTMPRTGRSLTRGGSLTSPIGYGNTNSASFCGCPGSSSAPQSPAKAGGQSKISAVSKLLMTSSPKTRSLSTSSTKSLSFSTKSLTQSSSRSSSLPPNGKPQNSVQGPVQPQGPSPGSWATQSLSRNRGGNLAAKLPLRAVNGRISELLQGNTGSRSRSHPQGRGTDPAEERGVGGIGSAGLGGGSVPVEDRTAAVQPLPSPYSKITAPRKPQRCSSGHASDNSSVLSGELPPAMGKTALFYHSGGSSGYESMLRDSSENTGSTSSAQDSLSEHSSATASSRRSSKSSKKSRSNTGLQRHRLIPALTLDSSSSTTSHRSSKLTITSSSSSSSSPGACWVDGPLGPHASPTHRGTAAMTETFEITVYEIDDVERLQRRREKGGNKDAVRVSAKLRLLEHRQQRISEVRARYQCLKKELEQTKQYLMLEPHRWTTEFELQQVYEVDSLEYLEALETVTDKLETRVNFCKAHLMMITCFDVSSRHR
ncbi:kinesin-like protein KIF26B isoform X2 [Thalassophryne amazonica]|uniref:kinesin-like protein KIF26B isoform X2 n=1 Tax=Thalassophryne amazonica TaxID=390379 RepID=UPI0014712825|nr:kinesin-like protein KIF26B isoform X2 [Thalassophryne amazonica]